MFRPGPIKGIVCDPTQHDGDETVPDLTMVGPAIATCGPFTVAEGTREV